jgi:hypothetical protein
MAWLMHQSLTPTRIIGALMIPMLLCLACVTLLPRALRAGSLQPVHSN